MKIIKIILIIVGVLGIVVFIVGKQSQAKIFFVGDMSFDRYIRQVVTAQGGDFVFSCISNTLQEADLVVGNLETTVTDNPSVSLNSEVGSPNNFTFTSPPATPELLFRHNIKL